MRLNQAWYMLGGGKEMLNEFYKSYNVTSLLAGNTSCQMGGWFRKEINTVDDLKGLKFRIGGFAGRVMQKLGCVPQQLAGGDIYPALEKGTIDAAEWVGPYDDEKLGLYKVAPHYYYPGWWEGGPMLLAMVNLEKWNALPKYYQSVLEQAGHYANNWMMAKYDTVNPMALKKLLAGGTKLHALLAGRSWKRASRRRRNCNAEVAATNPNFKKVYEFDDGLLEQRLSVVPGRRSRLRQLHGASLAELTAAAPHRAETRNPGAKAPGFRCCTNGDRYCFAGGPKSSGGRSICGTSILTLFRSTLMGLSSRPVTVTGKAITRMTMIACNPIQGIAPQ